MDVKRILVAIALAAVTYAIFNRSPQSDTHPQLPPQSHKPAIPVKSEKPEKIAITKSLSAPAADPSPERPTTNDENPYHIDPFERRKLDLPKPRSVGELLSKRTPFQFPILPSFIPNQGQALDGDVTTHYYGFYELRPGVLKAIRLSRTGGGIGITIEERSGRQNKWHEDQGKLKIENFASDPYSIVIQFPDGRLMYLKFHSSEEFDGLNLKIRVMSGYLLSESTEAARIHRVVIPDHILQDWDEQEREPRDPPVNWQGVLDRFVPYTLSKD